MDLTKVPSWSTMEVPIPSRLRLLSYQKMATNQVQSFMVILGPSGTEIQPTNNGATNTSLMLPILPSKTVAILSNMV